MFLSAFDHQPNILTLGTLVFLILQKFEFILHVKYCYVIRAWSSDFNPSSFNRQHSLKLYSRCISWRGAIELSSLGAGDLILSVLIAFKICHMPSYGWAMISKVVHQLRLLQLSKFDDSSPTMARVIAIYQKTWPRSNYVTSTPSMKLTLSWSGGLPTKTFQTKCVNKESSSEWRYFVQQGLTDLYYANAKGLIPSGRV